MAATDSAVFDSGNELEPDPSRDGYAPSEQEMEGEAKKPEVVEEVYHGNEILIINRTIVDASGPAVDGSLIGQLKGGFCAAWRAVGGEWKIEEVRNDGVVFAAKATVPHLQLLRIV